MRLQSCVVVLSCLIAAACGGQNGITANGQHAALTQAGPAAKTPGPPLYVADTATNAVDAFTSTDNGNVTPEFTISGPDTMLASPNGVAVAPDGTLFVANDGMPNSIDVYAPGSEGDAAPSRVITCGGLATPGGISLDGAGDLFVANTSGKSISVFGPTDSGCVSGNRTIVGIHTCLFDPQDVHALADGTAYVASEGMVLVFRPGAHGDATPLQRITGSNTHLRVFVMGVSVDSALNIYATSVAPHKHGRVTVYAPGADGNVAPLWTIEGSHTTLDVVDKIHIDPTDQAFVTNDAAVDIFSAMVSGNVAPVRVITGPLTTLVSPAGLDLAP
jgi:hypothetical protein